MIWRVPIIAAMLGLWLAVGIAWGASAALLFVYPVLVGCIVTAWGVFAGRMTQRAAGGYYERQLHASATGRWRDR